ncbi:MAG: adenosylcobinamide-GDP ribazoletransferase [Candidatus Omnitrophica bacterium]|nr:adenosylcobinamide-GDP ribazoletransferase [Candidatus Omnitrophota bacterium]
MKTFFIALGFLTKIPIPKKLQINDKSLAKSTIFFPLIGFFLGLILVFVNAILTFLLPDRLINLILILLLILLTGALHLDGFADTVDGFCAKTKNRKEILDIMKDSRIGAMGVIGLIILILFKYEGLNGIPMALKNSSLILMCTISRWVQVIISYFSKHAKDDGLGKTFVGNVGKTELYLATILAIAISFLFYFSKAIILLILISIFTWASVKYVHRKIGVVTGDTIGAISELAEVITLFSISMLGRV